MREKAKKKICQDILGIGQGWCKTKKSIESAIKNPHQSTSNPNRAFLEENFVESSRKCTSPNYTTICKIRIIYTIRNHLKTPMGIFLFLLTHSDIVWSLQFKLSSTILCLTLEASQQTITMLDKSFKYDFLTNENHKVRFFYVQR